MQKNSPGVTLEQIDIKTTEIPNDNTTVCDLKLTKHDIFSLKCDYTEQTTPLSSLLNVIHDIRGNDQAKISLCVEPYNRLKWNSIAEAAHERFKKGKTPKRVRLNGKNAFFAILGVLDKVYEWVNYFASEVIDIIDSIGSKDKRCLYHDKQRIKQKADMEKKKIMIDGKLSSETDKKKTAPVFKTYIRLASHSVNEVRRTMTLNSMVTAFDQLSENNEMKPSELSPKEQKQSLKEINSFKLTLYSKSDLDSNILSNYELGKLYQMPTALLQKGFGDYLTTKQIREVALPACVKDKNGLPIGVAEEKGNKVPVHLPLSNRNEHALSHIVICEQGGGKDTLASNIVVESYRKREVPFGKETHKSKIASILIDVVDQEGDGMSDQVRDSLLEDELKDYIEINLGRTDYPIYLDWSEGLGSNDREAFVKLSNELSRFLGTHEMVDTDMYLKDGAKAVGDNILDIAQLLTSKEYRKQIIQELEAKEQFFLLQTWKHFDSMGDKKQAQIAGNVLTRLHKLIGDDFLRNIFCQRPKMIDGKPAVNLIEWIREGKIIVFKFPKNKFTKTGTERIFKYLITKIWLAKMVMGSEGTVNVMMNEPHQFIGESVETLEDMSGEIRKYGLIPWYFFHDWAQVPNDLRDILLGAGTHLHIGSGGKKTFNSLKEELKEYTGDSATVVEECLKIQKHYFLHVIHAEGKKQQPFVAKGLDQPTKRYGYKDNSKRSEECLLHFGRPYQEVEKEIMEQYMKLTAEAEKKKENNEKAS
jgi:hypothetical protein